MNKTPLQGIKVVCFGWIATGPLTSKYFADLGAEVIKVESMNRLDYLRAQIAGKDGIPGLNRSAPFNHYNTSKLSVTIDISHPKGLELVKKLIARADITIDNFGAGAMEKWGLGYEDLKKVKPDIIMLSSCLQGHTGPYANSRGQGNILAGLTGFNHLAGWPDGEPCELGFYTDYIGPHYNLISIMAALDYRRRTGKGTYIDVSQHEQGLEFLAPLLLDYKVNGRVAMRMGNRLAYAAPHAAYRCRGQDRWCAIAVFTDEEWQSFVKVIGNPAWTKNAKFSTLLGRKKNEDELDRLVEEWTVEHTAEEVMEMMQAAGVPAGVVQTAEEVIVRDPQLKHQHFYWNVEHPEIGEYIGQRGGAFVLSKSPWVVQTAPMFGEHNEYVFKELLGMSDDEIADLMVEEVLK